MRQILYCPVFRKNNLIPTILASKELKEQVVESESEDEVTSRRSFLGNASLKGVVKHKKAFDDAVDEDELQKFEIDASVISKIKDKNLPNKRKILFTTLKRAGCTRYF